jgi:hypothetical protein
MDVKEKSKTNLVLVEGAKVIVRNNESGVAWVGTLIRWENFHNRFFPVIRFDGLEPKEYIRFGIIFPYHEKFLEFLNSLPVREAWDFSCKVSHAIQELHKMGS